MKWLATILSYLPYAALVAIIVFIIHLLTRLTMSNPFDRYFGKRRYEIINRRSKISTVHILRPRKNVDPMAVLKDAIWDSVYCNDDIEGLVIETDDSFPFSWEIIVAFRFLIDLDLRKFIISNAHEFDVVGYVQTLRIPEISGSIQFFEDCHELKDLFIPCKHFVPAYQFYGKPVSVARGFTVHVPNGLLDAYKESPDWSRIRFVSKDGDPITPKFLPAYSAAYFEHN